MRWCPTRSDRGPATKTTSPRAKASTVTSVPHSDGGMRSAAPSWGNNGATTMTWLPLEKTSNHNANRTQPGRAGPRWGSIGATAGRARRRRAMRPPTRYRRSRFDDPCAHRPRRLGWTL